MTTRNQAATAKLKTLKTQLAEANEAMAAIQGPAEALALVLKELADAEYRVGNGGDPAQMWNLQEETKEATLGLLAELESRGVLQGAAAKDALGTLVEISQ